MNPFVILTRLLQLSSFWGCYSWPRFGLLQLTSFWGYYSCVFAPLLPELLLQFRARQTLARPCFYTSPRGTPGKSGAECPRCGF